MELLASVVTAPTWRGSKGGEERRRGMVGVAAGAGEGGGGVGGVAMAALSKEHATGNKTLPREEDERRREKEPKKRIKKKEYDQLKEKAKMAKHAKEF